MVFKHYTQPNIELNPAKWNLTNILFFLLVAIFLLMLQSGNASAYYNLSYNTSFSFSLAENNGTNRTNMPMDINVTGLKNKISNCSNAILTQVVGSVENEVPSEVVIDNHALDGSCLIRFRANLTANTNNTFKLYGNSSAAKKSYPSQYYQKPWGLSEFMLWDDAIISPNGTLISDKLNISAGGYKGGVGSSGVYYGDNKTLGLRGNYKFNYSDFSNNSGCSYSLFNVGGTCTYCGEILSNGKNADPSYLNVQQQYFGMRSTQTQLVDYGDYPGISPNFYFYDLNGVQKITSYAKSVEWVRFCMQIGDGANPTKYYYINGNLTDSNSTGNNGTGYADEYDIYSANDAALIHWYRNLYASNNSYNTYNSSMAPIYSMGSEQALTTGNINFYDEETEVSLNGQNVYFQIINTSTNQQPLNTSTTSGNLNVFINNYGLLQFIYSGRNDTLNTQTYAQRGYFLNVSTLPFTNNISLYLLNNSKAVRITVSITDENGKALPGAIVSALRQYPDQNGVFKTIEMSRSNFDGSTFFYLQAQDAYYKFLVQYQGTNIFESSSTQIVSPSISISVRVSADVFSTFRNLRGVSYSLTYQNSSSANNFSLTYSDSTGLVQTGCLIVYQQVLTGSGQIQLCNFCASSPSSTLTCPVTNSNGTYTAQAVVYNVGNTSFLLDTKAVVISDTVSTFGKTGIIFTILFILMIVFAVGFSPEIAVLMAVLGLVISLISGFFSTPINLIFGLFIGAGIIILRMRQ